MSRVMPNLCVQTSNSTLFDQTDLGPASRNTSQGPGDTVSEDRLMHSHDIVALGRHDEHYSYQWSRHSRSSNHLAIGQRDTAALDRDTTLVSAPGTHNAKIVVSVALLFWMNYIHTQHRLNSSACRMFFLAQILSSSRHAKEREREAKTGQSGREFKIHVAAGGAHCTQPPNAGKHANTRISVSHKNGTWAKR
eukprot:944796-Pleurochrysis_carterae.AAC.2